LFCCSVARNSINSARVLLSQMRSGFSELLFNSFRICSSQATWYSIYSTYVRSVCKDAQIKLKKSLICCSLKKQKGLQQTLVTFKTDVQWSKFNWQIVLQLRSSCHEASYTFRHPLTWDTQPVIEATGHHRNSIATSSISLVHFKEVLIFKLLQVRPDARNKLLRIVKKTCTAWCPTTLSVIRTNVQQTKIFHFLYYS